MTGGGAFAERVPAVTRRGMLRGGALAPLLLAAACAAPRAGREAPSQGQPSAELRGKLVIALVGGEQQHPPAILEGFQARHPRLEIETISGAWNDTLDKVTSMLAAGTPPDVWYGEDGRCTGWGPRGLIRDLAPYIRRDMKESDYYQLMVTKDAQGRIWGVPGDLQVVALFYNTAAFDEAGLKYPGAEWTLADLTGAAQRLTDPGKKQYGFFAQPNYITTSWYLFPKLFGVGVLDDTGTKSQFDHPKVREAYEFLIGLMDRGLAPPFAEQGKYPFAPTPTAEGRSAMQFHIYARLGDANMKDHTYDVELVPQGPAARWTTVIANCWVIARDSRLPDAAWEWLKWHSQPEQQVIRGSAGTGLPMHRKAADEVVAKAPPPPRNRRAFLRSLEFAGPLGLNAVWQEWRTVAQNTLLKAWRKEEPLQNVLAETHKLVQIELDKFYRQ